MGIIGHMGTGLPTMRSLPNLLADVIALLSKRPMGPLRVVARDHHGRNVFRLFPGAKVTGSWPRPVMLGLPRYWCTFSTSTW